MTTTAPTLMLTAEEAAEQLRIGRTKVYELVASGELPSKKIGRSRRIPYDALAEYARSLTSETPPQ